MSPRGRMNNYNNICISRQSGECLRDGLLLTLETRDNPNQVFRELFNYQSTMTRSQDRRTNKEVIDFQKSLRERAAVAKPALPEEDNLDESTLEVPSLFRGN